MSGCLASIDVAILCGGQGRRLRPVLGDDVPKCLAPVAGRTLLDWQIDYLHQQGARRIVLCVGHLADKVADWLTASYAALGGLSILLSREATPQRTAGALHHARDLLTSDPVLAVNGDTLLDFGLDRFVADHTRLGAPITVLEARPMGKKQFFPAGYYLISREAFQWLKPGLRLPFVAGRHGLRYGNNGYYLDIGNPRRLPLAPEFLGLTP